MVVVCTILMSTHALHALDSPLSKMARSKEVKFNAHRLKLANLYYIYPMERFKVCRRPSSVVVVVRTY
jgi:hypothetical protein